MTARALTFSIQVGSGGESIARGVAYKLGYRYYDRQVVSEAAELAGVSPEAVANAERWPSVLERMLETLGHASALTDGLPGTSSAVVSDLLTMTSADYRQLIEQVINGLAHSGECVIVGHAGQAILRDRKAGMFKVLVHGSPARRAERLAQDRAIAIDEARVVIEEADKARVDFFKHVYSVEWLDSSLYDLTVNTDGVDIEPAISLVLTGAEAVR